MILVTGSTGLLGSHVVCELVSNGHAVRALHRSESRKRHVKHVLRHYFPESADELYDRIEWFEGDILDLSDLEDAMQGCEKVVHCAALVSFHRRDFWQLFEHNRKGTANVVNTGLKLGLRQLVHVSSTAAVGSDSEFDDGIRRETNHWNANEKVSGYSLSKYSAEKEVWRGIEEGLPAAIVNPSLLFGPGSWNESSLKIMRTLAGGLGYYTPGANAVVDVRDVALIIRKLLENEISGERYLVTGHNIGFKELFDRICRRLGVKAPSKPAGPFLAGMAWRIAGIAARFKGTRPTITKESAESSQSVTVFSSEKVMKQFPDFRFRSLDEMIDNTVKGKMLDA
jgi:dihydroflavonol-4-reductase